MSPDLKIAFLSLVRIGIGHPVGTFPESADWSGIRTLANAQGLTAIVLDGVEIMQKSGTTVSLPEKKFMVRWIGQVLRGFEYRHEQYRRALAEMAGFYRGHGLKMMVLKGYACSLDWPRPEHRPCGDIDIWLFGEQKRGDALVFQEKGLKIDNSHHHHSVFKWGEFMVENHYDFVNRYARRSSAEMEKVFKELGKDDSHSAEVCGEKVYLPSPNLHALFLLKHSISHFVGANINLRQVLDWAFFVEKHSSEVDWAWLDGMLEKYHMKGFFNCLNAICVEDLGFSSEVFPNVQVSPELPMMKENVLSDILEPAFAASEPKQLIPRLQYKLNRWCGNAWKQELCYSDSRWSAFWMGLWAKILKPASF